MRKTWLAVAVGVLLTSSGCLSDVSHNSYTDADRSDHRVTVFSGGKAVAEYVSDESPADRDWGHYFRDKKTGNLVIVSGTVVIEQLK